MSLFDRSVPLNIRSDSFDVVGKNFDEIPIWMPEAHGGFGDIMVTLKLAEGLKKEFPEKRVKVYFGQIEDYEKVRRLYPNFSPKKLEETLNGISVARIRPYDALRMRESLVRIFSPVAAFKYGNPYTFVMTSGINFYLEEYDCRESIRLPNLTENQVYVDKNGRKHLVLPTGFEEKSIGIHIDSSLTELDNRITPEIKERILEEANFGWIRDYVPRLMESEWGFAYYCNDDSFRTNSARLNLLKALIKSFEATGNWERAITIFDFSNVQFPNKEVSRGAYFNEPFRDVFYNSGDVEVILGDGSKFGKVAPNVNIVHVGMQNHSTFLDFLRYSQIPVAITGDASLAEAVSLRKPFVYHPPTWKTLVFPHLVERAPDLLENLDDINNVRSWYGCKKIKTMTENDELKRFYLRNRSRILSDRLDCFDEALKLFGNRGNFAIKMAASYVREGEEAELRILKKASIFGAFCGIGGNEKLQRLFYDQRHLNSFERLNQRLIQKMDIAKNLADLIREAVKSSV
jgi:hypothetical protein